MVGNRDIGLQSPETLKRCFLLLGLTIGIALDICGTFKAGDTDLFSQAKTMKST
jgi:hypothetical protein